jgi:phosphoribosylformylglycinamidine cyclo-ligase
MRYKDAGVDFNAARRAKAKITRLARQTFSKRVVRDIGAFGGFFSLRGISRDAVLVASVDGVGTKLKIAFKLNRHAGVGADLVNHCVNDITVHGAEPLFFLDYFATGKMRTSVVAEVVSGIAQACQEAGCALIGGETAEMPCIYSADEYDLAGTIVGWVRKSRIVDGSRIRPGDLIIGLPSLGLHTNGYTLARRVLLETGRLSLDQTLPDLRRKLGDELLAPHRCYASVVRPLLAKGWLKGLVHVTGGGITDNTPRILPAGCQAQIVLGTWPVLPVFDLIAQMGSVPEPEMLRTFNMGLGMLLVIGRNNVRSVASTLHRSGEKFWMVGQIAKGRRAVKYERRRC